MQPLNHDLPAAALEMSDLLTDALGVHIYSMEDGELPPADCHYVASIQRVRRALGLPPAVIQTEATNPLFLSAKWPDDFGDTISADRIAVPASLIFADAAIKAPAAGHTGRRRIRLTGWRRLLFMLGYRHGGRWHGGHRSIWNHR